jgi:DNA-binding response OmpR family regulator
VRRALTATGEVGGPPGRIDRPGGPPVGKPAARSAISPMPSRALVGDDRSEMSTRGSTVLVVEDERKIRELVRGYLEREGLGVLTTESGAEAITIARDSRPDLVVLDLRLPDVPGEEVAREVRAFSTVPILVLTAKAGEDDRIRGLELGADDYLTKPFSPRELVLRVKAILRRTSGGDPERPSSFGSGELLLDEARREVRVRGEEVALTPTEFGVLASLARSPGRVYSRYELINRVRGYEFEGYERTIDSHVKNLRRKIERDPRDPSIVLTVLVGGYRLGLRRDP